MKLAIVIHAFYEKEWMYLYKKLENLLTQDSRIPFDVIVTVVRGCPFIDSIVNNKNIKKVIVCDNLGMDIWPFLQITPILLNYDWVLKLHTKKGKGDLGGIWFRENVDGLIGSTDVFAKNVAILSEHPEWIMAGLLPFFLSAKRLKLANNYQTISELWGLSVNRDWGFFAGSFFWIKPQSFAKEFQLITSDFFHTKISKDGEMEHILERMVALLARKKGEIGLFLPCYKHKDWLVTDASSIKKISHALSRELLVAYRSISDDLNLIKSANLLNICQYQVKTGLYFSDTEQAIYHYLLYGRYSGFSEAILPLHRRKLNDSLVDWKNIQKRMKGRISIIIPIFNQLILTLRCIFSLLRHTKDADIEIVLIDNGSGLLTSHVLNLIKFYSQQIRIIRLSDNLGFAIASNIGMLKSTGEYCIFLNNDTEVTEGWIDGVLKALAQENVVTVQPKLLYPNGQVQCAGIVFDHSGFGVSFFDGREDSEALVFSTSRPALTAACLAIRAKDFIELRGFNPLYINGQEDIDFCLRLSQRWPQKVQWFCNESVVFHHTSQSKGRRDFIRQNRAIFRYFWLDDAVKGNHVKNCFLPLGNSAYKRGLYNIAREIYLYVSYTIPLLRVSLVSNLLQVQKLQNKDVSLEDVLNMQHDYIASMDDLSEGSIHTIFDDRHIITHSGITKVESFLFSSNSDDPIFYLQEGLSSIEEGFYGCSFFFLKESPYCQDVARLYVDYGNGFSEENVYSINLSNGWNTRVVRFKSKPMSLRFDPIETKGEFLFVDFKFFKLTDVFLRDYFKKFFKSSHLPIIKGNIDDFYNAYNQVKMTFSPYPYKLWMLKNETQEPDNKQIQELVDFFCDCPLFSVVIPTYNTDENYLRECLDSILNQRFNNVEICIADDNSTKQETIQVLREYDKKYENVKVVFRSQNGHICAATNSALRLASGKYIVLVDHDDVLAEDALFYVAQAISKHPDAKIIYSDEDKIDSKGHRYAPHFKSDWNYDLLLSQNYISHLGVYEHSTIKKIGGFRENAQVEGSQDYDLLLRCLPHVQDKEIVHIPRVLYHWRAIEGSTATSAGEKSYTTDAGIKALQNYFHLIGRDDVTVGQGKLANTYKVNWGIKHQPKVSLLIPTRDKKDITEVAVRSILDRTTYSNYEIIILDNGSVEPETLAFFENIQRESQKVKVLRYDYPFNYSAINNFGVKYTDGEIIGLVNNDVEVINPEWLTEMVSHAIRPEIGCVGAKLYYSNDSIQHAGVILGIQGVAGHSHKYFDRSATGYFSRLSIVQNVSAVTAACLLVRRSVYDAVDGLNEEDLKVAFNDVDFCLKVREAGFRNLWTPYAELYHYESISRGAEDNPEKIARFNKEIEYMKKRWGDLLSHDPYYSPNLTLRREDFSINVD